MITKRTGDTRCFIFEWNVNEEVLAGWDNLEMYRLDDSLYLVLSGDV